MHVNIYTYPFGSIDDPGELVHDGDGLRGQGEDGLGVVTRSTAERHIAASPFVLETCPMLNPLRGAPSSNQFSAVLGPGVHTSAPSGVRGLRSDAWKPRYVHISARALVVAPVGNPCHRALHARAEIENSVIEHRPFESFADQSFDFQHRDCQQQT